VEKAAAPVGGFIPTGAVYTVAEHSRFDVTLAASESPFRSPNSRTLSLNPNVGAQFFWATARACAANNLAAWLKFLGRLGSFGIALLGRLSGLALPVNVYGPFDEPLPHQFLG